MINEIEEGELSSDQEGENRKKLENNEFNNELILNNEEKSVLQKLYESGTESGEISDENIELDNTGLENPYAEEDVQTFFSFINLLKVVILKLQAQFFKEMMIQLKMKALKSLLEASQGEEEDEILNQAKKSKRLKKKPKAVTKSSESDEFVPDKETDRTRSRNSKFKRRVNSKGKNNITMIEMEYANEEK